MRALAEFIMRGRAQAALIAILMVPVLPTAAVALVTLRRGILDGLWILCWAFAPMLVVLWSDIDLLPLAMISISVLVAVFVGANLLRLQLGWAMTAYAVVALVVILGWVYLSLFSTEITAAMQQAIELHKENLSRQGIAYDEALMIPPPNRQLVAMGAFAVAVNALGSLALGRWWQAALYNPGGFRQEFNQLRLQPWAATALVAITVICVSADYRLWAWLSALPLVLVSVSLAHQFAGLQRMGSAWLVIFYLALFSLPFYLVMGLVGFIDAWTDIRSRLLPANRNQ